MTTKAEKGCSTCARVPASLAWLDEHAGLDDVVLAEAATGNRIPAGAGVRVVAGYWSETIDYEVRKAEMVWFFKGGTTDRARVDYLREFGVDFVYYSPTEEQLGNFKPDQATYLTPAFVHGAVTIYRILLPP